MAANGWNLSLHLQWFSDPLRKFTKVPSTVSLLSHVMESKSFHCQGVTVTFPHPQSDQCGEEHAERGPGLVREAVCEEAEQQAPQLHPTGGQQGEQMETNHRCGPKHNLLSVLMHSRYKIKWNKSFLFFNSLRLFLSYLCLMDLPFCACRKANVIVHTSFALSDV